jgi:putative ABC transport system permease protein
MHRPGALTPTVMLSLGLGLALLVTVIEIDGNLRRQFSAALPVKAPSFYFVDIQAAEGERFDRFVRAQAPSATLERVPMMRGRIVAAAGVRAEDLRPPANIAWVLQSDRGVTFASEMPRGSRLSEGKWWAADYDGPPLVSLERRVADGLGLKIGDAISVNVLGREITASVANIRSVDWQSLGINFVLVFSPSAFSAAPHSDIATLSYPGGGTSEEETALSKAVADAFPAITTVRVKDALEAVGSIVTNLVLAVRGASMVALLGAVLVLGGALAAGHRHRVYDAVILKTLGATRAQLLVAFALEYVLLGIAAALFGTAVGTIAGWLVVTELMNLAFVWLPLPAILAVLGALTVMVTFGLLGTFVALGHKAAPVLRNM